MTAPLDKPAPDTDELLTVLTELVTFGRSIYSPEDPRQDVCKILMQQIEAYGTDPESTP